MYVRTNRDQLYLILYIRLSKKLYVSAIRCAIGYEPEHGSFVGNGIAFGDVIRCECDTGYRMKLLNRDFKLVPKISTELTCGVNGLFEGMDGVVDCECKKLRA